MFGINIGNTNASIAFCKENGKAELIPNERGDRLTQAIVNITENEIYVGTTDQVLNRTIIRNKSLMSGNQLEHINYSNNIEIQTIDDEISYCIPLREKLQIITPQNIARCIFKELLTTAKSALAVEDNKLQCVLLMPGGFPDEYYEQYKLAAEEAGWEVLQIINEAAAAILAYSLLESKDEMPQNVIVYRLGGTTCEVTACELSDGMMTTLGLIRREDIGGYLFVEALANLLSDEFFRKYKLDPREKRRSFEKLKRASQNCIHVLSNLPMSSCLIESLHEGIDFSVNLSRARFELIIKPLLEKCVVPLQVLMHDLKLNGFVDKVVLCGGATNIRSLKLGIASLFDGTMTQILSHINPEEVLAIGGAKQAYYLSSNDCEEFLPRYMDITLETIDPSSDTSL